MDCSARGNRAAGAGKSAPRRVITSHDYVTALRGGGGSMSGEHAPASAVRHTHEGAGLSRGDDVKRWAGLCLCHAPSAGRKGAGRSGGWAGVGAWRLPRVATPRPVTPPRAVTPLCSVTLSPQIVSPTPPFVVAPPRAPPLPPPLCHHRSSRRCPLRPPVPQGRTPTAASAPPLFPWTHGGIRAGRDTNLRGGGGEGVTPTRPSVAQTELSR